MMNRKYISENCKNAEIHYYDFLIKKNHKDIPREVFKHIKECQFCQTEISRLGNLFSLISNNSKNKEYIRDSAISSLLKLHFTYIDIPVRCSNVKPFLPSLVDPALLIKVQTPITLHIDKCEACQKNLRTIADLELSHKQLCRLSQLLAEKPIENATKCLLAQDEILSFVSMKFDNIDPNVLKHLCICLECRKKVYQFRDTLCERLSYKKIIKDDSFCKDISNSDLFDSSLPYGTNSLKDIKERYNELNIQHFRSCTTCLAKIQNLHNMIFDIVEQPDTTIVTLFNLKEQFNEQINGTENILTDLSIKKSDQEIPMLDALLHSIPVGLLKKLKKKTHSRNFKYFTKIIIVFAILSLLIFSQFRNTSPAKATSLTQIISNAEKHENVYISTFSPGKTESTEEEWISRSLNFKIYKTDDELVLWDIKNKEMRIKNLESGLCESRPLTKIQINNFKFSLQYILSSKSNFLPNDELRYITNQSITENGDEYEITWQEEHYNCFIDYRLKVFTDSTTELPLRVESYRKKSTDDEYELDTITTFQYLREAKLSAVKDKYF